MRRKVNRVGELQADVPGWLDDVVMRMLAQEPGLTKTDAANPAKRYVDMAAVQVALRAQGKSPQEALRPSNKRLLAIIALAILVGCWPLT